MDAFITYRKTLTFPDTVQGTPLDMSAAHFGKLISFLTASKRHTCYLHGNEPALHPELPRLVAMARKKKILPFVATSGLMSETVKKLILEAQIPLLWKLYHPQFYDETQWQTMAENCVRLRSALPDRFRLAVIFHDPAQDYSHIPEFVHRAGVGDVSLRVLRADEPRRFEDFVARLVALVVSLTEAGVHVGLDCGLPPCFLSDEQFGALAKIDRLSKRCVPHPGVLPDLRVYHCPEMIDDASANFLRFRRRTEVIDHFYKRYSGLERDSELFEECPQCTARRRDTCHGRCMAVKRTVAVGDVERLRRIAEEKPEAETLTRLAVLWWHLSDLNKTEQYLNEAKKADPRNVKTRLALARLMQQRANPAAAEAEYREAARLAPEGDRILLELGKFFHEQGRPEKAKEILDQVAARENVTEERSDDTPSISLASAPPE